jgi:excisionase family DNA binding protein
LVSRRAKDNHAKKDFRLPTSPPDDAEDVMSKDLTKYVTTRQAAELFGVGQEHIRKLLIRGKVKGMQMGRDWIVFVPSIERYMNTKSPKGRPPSGTPQIQVANKSSEVKFNLA